MVMVERLVLTLVRDEKSGAALPPEGAAASSDESLLVRAGRGDQGAFEALMVRYQERIFHFALRLCGDPGDAEDLTQETFLKAWRALPGFRGDAKFSTWLFQIAKNLAINGFHRRRRRHEDRHLSIHAGGDGLDRDAAPQIESPDPDPHDDAMSAELRRQLQAAIAALDPNYRAALVLRDVEGLDYAEIAKVVGVPVGTVKSRIHRARTEVQAALAPYLSGDRA